MDFDPSTLSHDEFVTLFGAMFREGEARLTAAGDNRGRKTLERSHALAAKVSEKHKASGALLRSGAEGKEP